MYNAFFKRVFDLLVSLLVFVISLPLSLVLMVLLTIYYKGNPFFSQLRPGLHGKLFRLIKFKTMNDQKDANGDLLPDSQRLNWVGLLLRKTSLDEIPQLLNVIIGDMSLVGPRPLLAEYLPLYDSVQARRHEVLPGITGWAQVNGRNAIGWQKKFDYDIWYVDHVSFWTDLKILLLTLKKVIHREGINAKPDNAMEKFSGKESV